MVQLDHIGFTKCSTSKANSQQYTRNILNKYSKYIDRPNSNFRCLNSHPIKVLCAFTQMLYLSPTSHIEIVHKIPILYVILMLYLIFSLLFIVVVNEICFVISWNPSNFSFNPGDNYELVWQDEFENVGPVKAIIDGKPAYSPNPKNWIHLEDSNDAGLQRFTDSIYNSYVQENQLTIAALKEENEGFTSAILSSKNLQEFIFGVWAAKIRLPYGQGIWPAWWCMGNADAYNLTWPTVGEIDTMEMVGGNKRANLTDQYAYGTIHWNNQSNTMNPVYNKFISVPWRTPDGSMLHNNSLVYWSEWTPTKISIGVNEFVYNVINTTHLNDSINPVWAFRGVWPFYMILDVLIGGTWPGPPDNTTVWPQKMVFDWIRVYQRKKDIISS